MEGYFSINRPQRLSAIKAYILAEIANPDLCLADIAAQQRISASYVRKLFASQGTKFTAFVLETRLENVCRMLTASGTDSIATVAMACGFNDVSYFNRAFRKRYGCTPSDLRSGRWPLPASTAQSMEQQRLDSGSGTGFAPVDETGADQR